MALYATNMFAGDGVTTQYEINFVGGYIDKSHVKAYVIDDTTREIEHVQIDASWWLNDTTISGFDPTPVGKTLVIYRDTTKTPLVDFVDGSRLTEHNLDLVAKQGLFVATEQLDRQDYGELNASAAAGDAEMFAAQAAASANAAELSALNAESLASSAQFYSNDAQNYASAASAARLNIENTIYAALSPAITAASDFASAAESSAAQAAASAVAADSASASSAASATNAANYASQVQDAINAAVAQITKERRPACSRLVYVSRDPILGTKVRLTRANGASIVIDNIAREIPEAGIDLTLPLTQSIYNIYVSWTGSTMSLFASTQAPVWAANKDYWTSPDGLSTYVGSASGDADDTTQHYKVRSAYNGRTVHVASQFPSVSDGVWTSGYRQSPVVELVIIPGDFLIANASLTILSSRQGTRGNFSIAVPVNTPIPPFYAVLADDVHTLPFGTVEAPVSKFSAQWQNSYPLTSVPQIQKLTTVFAPAVYEVDGTWETLGNTGNNFYINIQPAL